MSDSERGSRTIAYLIERGRLERITVQDTAGTAKVLLDRAARRLHTTAYDSYRMAAEALLAWQGMRAAGGDGSPMTVEDAVSAQFAVDIPAFAKPTFERFRRTRHSAQYFDPDAAPITPADARWAIEKATEALARAARLLPAS